MRPTRSLTHFAIITVAVMILLARCSHAQTKYFTDWPEGADPKTIGDHLAQHYIETPHRGSYIGYSEVCVWYGALSYADSTANATLRTQLQARFDPLLRPEGQSLVPDKEHVDFEVFGVVPLQISIENHDQNLRSMGLRFADRQWSKPQPDGLSGETRFWIDDMFMITMLQVQAYRSTGDRKYIDRAALEMTAYLDKLQQPNGLFFHAPDVPFFWGRGDGWVAVGMTEMLLSLPADHPKRPAILAGYHRMMAELLKQQAPDGTWRQLIDHPESWPETSSTGMFTYALIQGVKHGWLEEKAYGPAARRGWIALAGYIDQNYDMTSVCAGTNKENSYAYYMARPRRTGDFHGQAPALWAARALLEH
jgi:unsaturated rhamnogalacturonyl hydrolase